jgi:hypothetical protein
MQGDDENDDREFSIPQQLNVKKDSTKDLLTIFSDLVTVKFKRNSADMETVRGRWCLLCKYVTQNQPPSRNETDPNAEVTTRL